MTTPVNEAMRKFEGKVPSEVIRNHEAGTFYRTVAIRADDVKKEERTIEVAFSSETPVERWVWTGRDFVYGYEVLDHDKADMSFLESGRAPVLKDHDKSQQVGVIVSARLDSDRVGRAVLRYGSSEQAESEFRDIVDGIRQNISFGYTVTEVVEEESGKDGGELPTFRMAFRPFEISTVPIPADETVGVGRESQQKQVIEPKTEVKPMTAQVEVKDNARDLEAQKADMQREVSSAREKEVSRVREILAVGERHNMVKEADEAIKEGVSVSRFRGLVLDKIENQPVRMPEAEIDFEKGEAQKYSLLRAINAAATKDWSQAGFERECSMQLAKQYGRDPQGFFVPSNIDWAGNHGRRDLTVASTTGGSKLKGTDQRGDLFIDALRAEMVLSDLGVTYLTGLKGDVDIPTLSAKTTVAFMTAEMTNVTEGAPQFSQKQLAPKTCSGWVDISRKLRIQSDPSVEQIVRNDIIQQIASKIEDVAFEGGGSGEPSGLINCSNINVVSLGTNGAAPTYAATVDMIQQVAIDNALRGRLAYVGSPQAWYKMATTAKVSSTDSVMILNAEMKNLNGFPMFMTTNVPSDLTKGSGSSLSALFFGNFQDLLVAFWSGVDIVVDTATLSNVGGLRLNFFQDVDVTCRHDESFAVIKDMVTS